MRVQPEIYGTVMIVDDALMDILLIKNLLQELNMAENIVSYDNPLEAFVHINGIVNGKNSQPFPDIIFLDLNMPEMSGYQFMDLFEKLTDKRARCCKVIIVTSSDAIEDIEKSTNYRNVIKYFFKPLSKIDFTEVIMAMKKYT